MQRRKALLNMQLIIKQTVDEIKVKASIEAISIGINGRFYDYSIMNRTHTFNFLCFIHRTIRVAFRSSMIFLSIGLTFLSQLIPSAS